MPLKIVLLCVVAVVAVGVFVAAHSSLEGGIERSETEDVVLKIGEGTFTLRLAQTPEERARGLSGVETLEPEEGMFFVFPEAGKHAIWMRDMRIPLDLLWLTDELVVIDARERVSPNSFPEIFTPRADARFVVELSAGAISAFEIRVGERAQLISE